MFGDHESKGIVKVIIPLKALSNGLSVKPEVRFTLFHRFLIALECTNEVPL